MLLKSFDIITVLQRTIEFNVRFRFQQVDEKVENREIDLNAIERSEVLTHPTASRVKAPKRRPPSGINFKEVRIRVLISLALATRLA